MTNADIAACLNSKGDKTPTGKTYTPKLVWDVLQKYERRKLRENGNDIQLYSEEFVAILDPDACFL